MVAGKAVRIGVAVLGAVSCFGLELRTTPGHGMQYHVSLPEVWSKGKTWPVVMVIESANKEFAKTHEEYRKARGKLPFIIVTPLVTTNGGARYREAPEYRYSDKVWAEVEKQGRCRWDTEGLAAVAADVSRVFGGEKRYFLAGLEAAGHTIWMQVLTHPERLRGAVAVAPNYQGRCVEELGVTKDEARKMLPVRVMAGAMDEYWKEGMPFPKQAAEAAKRAEGMGYPKVETVVVPGKGHENLAAEVLEYFAGLWKPQQPVAVKVVDEAGRPVEKANVWNQGNSNWNETEADGGFQVPSKVSFVVIRKEGFATEILKVDGNEDRTVVLRKARSPREFPRCDAGVVGEGLKNWEAHFLLPKVKGVLGFPQGNDVDYGTRVYEFAAGGKRSFLQHGAGGMWTFGYPQIRDVQKSARYSERQALVGGSLITDGRGHFADGTRWRYLGRFGESLTYETKDLKAAEAFDRMMDGACYRP